MNFIALIKKAQGFGLRVNTSADDIPIIDTPAVDGSKEDLTVETRLYEVRVYMDEEDLEKDDRETATKTHSFFTQEDAESFVKICELGPSKEFYKIVDEEWDLREVDLKRYIDLVKNRKSAFRKGGVR